MFRNLSCGCITRQNSDPYAKIAAQEAEDNRWDREEEAKWDAKVAEATRRAEEQIAAQKAQQEKEESIAAAARLTEAIKRANGEL